MSKKYDVIALGELLVDFTESGLSQQGNPLLEANPGGAPCNVLAMLTRLGKKTSFIGKIGKDSLGMMLKEAVTQVGIGTDGLCIDPEIPTTLAFVHTAANGDRSFSFYRQPGADMCLTEADVKESLFEEAKVFHYGTLSMTHEGCRKATIKAIELARKNNMVISFDPNLREPLWGSLTEAKEAIEYGLNHCDILKISDNEIQFITGAFDIEEGIKILANKYPIKVIFATLGAEGSIAIYKGRKVVCPPFLRDNTIETTGAGDTFMGCVLSFLIDKNLDDISEEELKEMLTFANAGASLITTRKGALKVMPTREEIENSIL